MQSTAQVNPVLTGLAQDFMAGQNGYVGTDVAPVFNTGVSSAQYYKWDRENYLDLPEELDRAPGTEYQTLKAFLADDSFICKDVGTQVPLDDTEISLYASYFAAERAKSEKATLAILVHHERKVKEMLEDPQVPTAAFTANVGTATIAQLKADFRAATEAVRLNCGMRPTVTTMSETVRNALVDNENISQRLQYTIAGGVATNDSLAAILDIPPISVASTIINSADAGATTTPADLWDDSVYLTVSRNTNALDELNFARTFAWTNSPGGTGVLTIDSYRAENKVSTIYRSRAYRGQKLTAPLAGYSLTGALA